MDLSRRSLLSLLASGVGLGVVDRERLLWVPGKRLISIPPSPTTINDIFLAQLPHARSYHMKMFDKYEAFHSNLSKLYTPRGLSLIPIKDAT